MRVLTPKDGDLTNAEVLAHLQTMRQRYNKQALGHHSTPLKSGNLETVIRELEEYLASSASHLDPNTPVDLQLIKRLVRATVPFGLTKGEVLQIINLRPENIPVLDTIVEELDERLDEERQLELLRIIRLALGGEFLTPEPEEQPTVEESMEGS